MGNFSVVHLPERSRFELRLDGVTAGELDYALDGSVATMFHTAVFPEFGGQGGGAALAHAALETARDRGWSVLPTCSFVRGYVVAHPEYADLVASTEGRMP